MSFHAEDVSNWEDFLCVERKFSQGQGWAFRGQVENWPLETTLRRALNDWEICNEKASKIEIEMMRDFRRKYDGKDSELVRKDIPYCLALMQHFGAPTRLLDFTYSIYVALFFSVQKVTQSEPVIWAINGTWTEKRAHEMDLTRTFLGHLPDYKRGGGFFARIFLSNRSRFIHQVNPLILNERQIIQQGVFLVPASISVPFEENLTCLRGFRSRKNVVKIHLKIRNSVRLEFLRQLHKMNISEASLFPGLEGFSEAFKNRIWLYESIADRRKTTWRSLDTIAAKPLSY